MPTFLSKRLKKIKQPAKKALKVYTVLTSLVTIIIVLLLLIVTISAVYADSCKNISNKDAQTTCYEQKAAETQRKLTDTKAQLDNTLNTINQLASQLNVTQSELDKVQSDINNIKAELDLINQNLVDRNQKLSDKIDLRNTLLRNYSKRNMVNDLELFFTRNEETHLTGFQFSTFLYAFNKSANEEVLNIIGALNSEISGFEKNKKESEDLKTNLETAQNNLVSLKKDLDSRKSSAQSTATDLSKQTTAYEQELESLQAKITSLKYGDESGTVGDYVAPGAKTPSPPFKPAFAVFSYGAYTHNNGMSQYGAKGRADSGDDYKEILKFYYKVGTKKVSDFPSKISVQGYGNLDFQYYLYGIAEMPSDWNSNALKAQAIAARTYAYKSNKPICTTQACQVFSKSKAANPPSKWKQAVDDTKGVILDNPKTAQYSSTTGGYINNIGWDVDGKWPNDAYEKKAGSPWFYKAWFTKSYNDSSTCGHPHPWLKESEMADILNAWVVYSKGTSGEKSHITPLTTSCWGGDPYSIDEMASKADKYGDKYTGVSKVWVDISNSGYTSKVHFQTNKGEISIDGSVFKTVFNLRAPGWVSIKSKLFDFELKN